MKRKSRFLVLVLLIAALQLAACAKAPEAVQEQAPVKVEHIAGSEIGRLTLTQDAANRLDLQTDSVQVEDIGGAQRVVIPYASVLYDTAGQTWVYTATDALTFVRTPIDVDSIRGDDVILRSGPPAGTSVVTVGAEELFGSETEFAEE